ncbi:outer membrane beta-barrel family protein [Flavobacterium psychrophilum]|uniref:outer membrane beta-barrel family protein n=1 Tax=Flavobacterium psychrophilum TaxID=96345 RepID=UPI00106CDE15|nr:outer membrane beta-barrel family protein [Flavobacterium psychrophilum]MCB6098646.1 TonB-dependent receptor family protein [Flavobacterium psychrophilum]
MKIKILILITLLNFTFVKAQNSVPETKNSGSISGKVIDKKTNEVIPYASITIKDGTKIISGAITKENGIFSITNLALQELTVEVQFIGYKKQVNNITLTTQNKNITLKTIALEEEATQLNEVSIVKERSSIEQKIDRKIVTVGKDLIASGTTASEIMNNIPTVSIDPQTKELSLRGNTNVKVLVDGKPTNISATQLLQQIPSSSIKQIELITNPSAKYSPEGMSGIINIILHKNANTGFNGSINSGVTFGKTPKLNTALNLNYKIGKVNIYTNYGLNHGKNKNHGYINSFRPMLENEQQFEFDNLNTSHLLKLGLDYYINDKNTFSIYTNQNITNGSGYGLTDINYINATNSDSSQLFKSKSDENTQTYDLDFKHDFTKKGENIEFQVNVSNTKDKENTNYDLTQFNPISSALKTNIIHGKTNYIQFNADYVNPLTETTKLEVGLETRIQNTENNFDESTNKPTTFNSTTTNNAFTFNRNITALYTNYSKQWEKWSGQVGIRIENYTIDGDFQRNENAINPTKKFNGNQTIKDNILSFYPSAFFTYAASEKNAFNFNYSRRVDRPSIEQISPIREWTTPLVESRGNPELKPQFTHSFEINYTRTTKIGSITSGVFYRQINSEISRSIYKNPSNNNQDILSYANFNSNNAYGIETSANLKFTKWWSANASADAYFKTVRGTVENAISGLQEKAAIDVISFNARLNQTFSATKNLKINLFGMYRGRDLGLQFERSPMYKADIGATYTFLKGKGSITGRLNDVFNTMHFQFDSSIPYKQTGAFYWESRTVYIGLNYMFGGGKNKALQRKQRDENETQSGGGLL